MDNKERFIEIFTSQIHRPGAAELLEWLESTDFFEAPASTCLLYTSPSPRD